MIEEEKFSSKSPYFVAQEEIVSEDDSQDFEVKHSFECMIFYGCKCGKE